MIHKRTNENTSNRINVREREAQWSIHRTYETGLYRWNVQNLKRKKKKEAKKICLLIHRAERLDLRTI